MYESFLKSTSKRALSSRKVISFSNPNLWRVTMHLAFYCRLNLSLKLTAAGTPDSNKRASTRGSFYKFLFSSSSLESYSSFLLLQVSFMWPFGLIIIPWFSPKRLLKHSLSCIWDWLMASSTAFTSVPPNCGSKWWRQPSITVSMNGLHRCWGGSLKRLLGSLKPLALPRRCGFLLIKAANSCF